jgi:hypothetical protein
LKHVLRILVFVAYATVALADKIVLKDGRTYEGEILEETADKVRIKTAKTTLSFTTDQIASVERGMSGTVERTKKLEALDRDKPASYLELARWLATGPAELQDDAIMRRICSAAAFLDPAQAAEAQLLLAKVLLSQNKKQEAADAFARALAADPKSTAAREGLEGLIPIIEESCRRNLELLKKALTAVSDSRYADAVPLLRSASHAYFAGRCKGFTGMTMWDLADDLQRRVPCLACKGATKQACAACKGAGALTCTKCDGKGVRKTSQEKPTFAQEVCTQCFHVGLTLCDTCDAERFLTVVYKEPVDGHKMVDVKVQAGKERGEMSKACSLSTWMKDGVEVMSISAGPLTKGGTLLCKSCRGIPYNPPQTSVNVEGVQAYLAQVEAQLKGTAKIEAVSPADTCYDTNEVAGEKFRWENGKWR